MYDSFKSGLSSIKPGREMSNHTMKLALVALGHFIKKVHQHTSSKYIE